MSEPLELDDATIARVLADLKRARTSVRTRLTLPRAAFARSIWDRIAHTVEPDRHARLEAVVHARTHTAPPAPQIDPRLAAILAHADALHADSWLRVRAFEARAGRRARRVTIDVPYASPPRAPRAAERFIAVAIANDAHAERACIEVALGDLHLPVRYAPPGDACRGALAIVDADWGDSQPAAGLARLGRPLIVPSTSGAHERAAPAAVYDPLVPEMLAEAVRTVLRLG